MEKPYQYKSLLEKILDSVETDNAPKEGTRPGEELAADLAAVNSETAKSQLFRSAQPTDYADRFVEDSADWMEEVAAAYDPDAEVPNQAPPAGQETAKQQAPYAAPTNAGEGPLPHLPTLPPLPVVSRNPADERENLAAGHDGLSAQAMNTAFQQTNSPEMEADEDIPELFHRGEAVKKSSGVSAGEVALFGIPAFIVMGIAAYFILTAGDVAKDSGPVMAQNEQAPATSEDGKVTYAGVIDEAGAGILSVAEGALSSATNKLTHKDVADAKVATSQPTTLNELEDSLASVVDAAQSGEPVEKAKTIPPATLNALEDSLASVVKTAQSDGFIDGGDAEEAADPEEKAPEVKTAQADPEPAPAAKPAPEPAPATEEPAPAAETSGATATEKASDRRMRELTDNVVRALSALKEDESSGTATPGASVDKVRDALSELVTEANQQGGGANVKMLLEEAIGGDQKKIPNALKNAEGKLDLSTLIASVVKKAGGSGPLDAADQNYLAEIEQEGSRTAMRANRVEERGGKRYIVVKPGDTLSNIAYAIYGDAFAYPKIFQANRDKIDNPNQVRIGMRLTIPE
jgi:nucleoid-associated protein YgaU